MKDENEWYEDDQLWETLGDVMFSFERWDAAPKEIDSLIKTLDLTPEARILDLCCGPGRHSLDLARRGYKVTGVDRTTHYLDMARDKAVWEGLKVEWVQEDMRRFVRPAAFDVALNMFTTFGYFEKTEDERQVARNVFESLKPGGRWVIELMGKEALARIYQPRDWIEKDDYIMLEERILAPDWSHMNMRWILLRDDHKYEYNLKVRMYSAVELGDLLRSVGFAKVEVFGDLDGSPYDTKARRMITVASKS